MSSIFKATDPTISRLASGDAAMVRAKSGLSAKKLQDIEASAKDFEGVFLNEMLTHMFDTVGVDSMFGGGDAEETWRGMMVEQFSKQLVNNGGIGMSDSIKAQMIAMQEEANK